MSTSRPIARRTDPASSHLAAADITADGTRAAQHHQVLRAVRRWPGLTSRELAQAAGGDRYVVARRLPEVESTGLVHRGPMRPCRVSGRQALTWWPADGNGQGVLW